MVFSEKFIEEPNMPQLARRFPWVMMTPLGLPVEPEVYCRSTMSFLWGVNSLRDVWPDCEASVAVMEGQPNSVCKDIF